MPNQAVVSKGRRRRRNLTFDKTVVNKQARSACFSVVLDYLYIIKKDIEWQKEDATGNVEPSMEQLLDINRKQSEIISA